MLFAEKRKEKRIIVIPTNQKNLHAIRKASSAKAAGGAFLKGENVFTKFSGGQMPDNENSLPLYRNKVKRYFFLVCFFRM